MGLLRDKALDWATVLWENQPHVCSYFPSFIAETKEDFDHPVQGKETAKHQLTLHQYSRYVAEYVVEFRTLAADLGWNDEALQGIFLIGLGDRIKDELVAKDDPSNLDFLISLATKMDNRLQECQRERTRFAPELTTSHPSWIWST